MEKNYGLTGSTFKDMSSKNIAAEAVKQAAIDGNTFAGWTWFMSEFEEWLYADDSSRNSELIDVINCTLNFKLDASQLPTPVFTILLSRVRQDDYTKWAQSQLLRKRHVSSYGEWSQERIVYISNVVKWRAENWMHEYRREAIWKALINDCCIAVVHSLKSNEFMIGPLSYERHQSQSKLIPIYNRGVHSFDHTRFDRPYKDYNPSMLESVLDALGHNRPKSQRKRR